VAEGGWLGMDAVASPDLRGVLVANSQLRYGRFQSAQVLFENVDRLERLDCQSGVDDVGRGQPEVDEAPRFADAFGQDTHERDHVVMDLTEQLVHAALIELHSADLDHRL
jgi:hypothetical protein